MNTFKDLLNAFNDNFKSNKKELNQNLTDLKKSSSAGRFFVPVAKIDCFFENIKKQIDSGGGVLVYSDYDVDGIFSNVMLLEYIKSIAEKICKDDKEKLKAFISKLRFKIPNRDEGYGISSSYIKSALNTKNIDYIITADNGTHASVIDVVQDKNFRDKIFVFDHHSNGDFSLNDNIFNPNDTGKVEISTGILLYKFFEKLGKRHSINLPNLSDLATFTAVSDVASLNSNRDILEDGFNLINNAESKYNQLSDEIESLAKKTEIDIEKGDLEQAKSKARKLQKLFDTQENLEIDEVLKNRRPLYGLFFGNKKSDSITTKDLSFGAIPMINTLNRLGVDTTFFVRMLMMKQTDLEDERNVELINRGFQMLHNLNDKRKKISFEATREAIRLIKENELDKNPFIFIYMENLNIGLAGLVAQKIFDETGADTIVASKVFSHTGEEINFSGRGNNIYKNLEILSQIDPLNSDKIFNFGGHLKALGGSIKDLEGFEKIVKKALNENKFLEKISTNQLEIKTENSILLSSPINLVDYVELSKHLTQRTGAIPYEKNFLAPVVISDDMIINKDDALIKAKNKDFVLLKIAFKLLDKTNDDEKSKVTQINFIAKSDDAIELINKSKESLDKKRLPIFYMELSNNCIDTQKETFSGKLIFKEGILPSELIEKKPQVKAEITKEQKSAIKI